MKIYGEFKSKKIIIKASLHKNKTKSWRKFQLLRHVNDNASILEQAVLLILFNKIFDYSQ